jgi:hypothetical protein
MNVDIINQWVISTDKYAVVIIVLTIIFTGVALFLFYLSNQIKKLK